MGRPSASSRRLDRGEFRRIRDLRYHIQERTRPSDPIPHDPVTVLRDALIACAELPGTETGGVADLGERRLVAIQVEALARQTTRARFPTPDRVCKRRADRSG
jgi:hypothetical protein